MDHDVELIRKRQELSEASRNDYWLRTLSPEKRALLGKAEYRRQCRLARDRLKAADEACLRLKHAKPLSEPPMARQVEAMENRPAGSEP